MSKSDFVTIFITMLVGLLKEYLLETENLGLLGIGQKYV